MKVNFFDGDVVDFCFGGTEEFEGLDCCVFDGRGQRCGVDEVTNYGEGAAMVCVFVIVGVTGFVLVLCFGLVLIGVACWCV